MNRNITDPNAIEFNEAYIVMARYSDVGWDWVEIYGTREDAAEKMRDLCPSEFKPTEIIMREVSLIKIKDITFNAEWFNDDDD